MRSAREVDAYLAGETVTCLLCGRAFRSVGHHIVRAHAVSVEDYQDRFGIPRTRSLAGEETRAAFAASVTRSHEAGKLLAHVRQLAAQAGAHGEGSKRTKRLIAEQGVRRLGKEPSITHATVASIIATIESGVTAAGAVKRAGIAWSSFHAALRRHPDLKARYEALPIRKGRRQ